MDLIRAAAVRALLGDVSAMTLWRMIHERGFPPGVKFAPHKRAPRYWRRADVEAWIERSTTPQNREHAL